MFDKVDIFYRNFLQQHILPYFQIHLLNWVKQNNPADKYVFQITRPERITYWNDKIDWATHLKQKNNIKQFIKSLSPAFELIIDRGADYSNINPLTMITDNAWCSGIVLGKELPNWEKLNLDIIRSKLLWNNDAPQNAMIKDANPLESLAWVSNLLISLGRTIPKDSIIITGSVIKTRAPNKGDHIIYKIEDLSEVEIKVI